MADNTPTNVTTSPGQSPTTTAYTGPGANLAGVRVGFATLLAVVALFLLGVGGYYLYFAPSIASEPPADTWWLGFKNKNVWPIAIWGLLFGAAGLAGAWWLFAGAPAANRDRPEVLSFTLAVCLFVAAVAVAAVPIYLVSIHPLAVAISPLFVVAVALFGVLLIGGILLITDAPNRGEQRLRLVLMGTGLGSGLCVFCLGIALAVITFNADIGQGLENWIKRPAVLILPTLAYLAGLALMFVAVQPAEPLIRTDQNIRRVVFGTNLAVTVLLLLGVLALPNVLAYAEPMNSFFNRSFNWTESGVHTLAPQLRNFLGGLREPVRVYVVMPSNHLLTADVSTLLNNCKAAAGDQFKWSILDPRSRETRETRLALLGRAGLPDQMGLLLVKGDDEKGDVAFVKIEDLVDRTSGRDSYKFSGQRALLNALITLAEGQMTIYFTTGHGELSLGDAMPMVPGMQQRGNRGELSILKQRLTARESVQVKPLKLDRSLKKIPDDAAVVVIARPIKPFDADELKLLRDYLKRERQTRKDKDKNNREVETVTAGKLFVLMPTETVNVGGKDMIYPTGLDPLLSEYGVSAGNNRVLTLSRRPTEVIISPDAASQNAIAQAFCRYAVRGQQVFVMPHTRFIFEDVRTVSPASKQGKTVENVLLAEERVQDFWVETNFKTPPVNLVEDLLRNEALRQKVLAQDDQPVAVAVSDGGRPDMPPDKFHAGVGGKQTPRMIVFGSSSWITDPGMSGAESTNRFNLFSSCITWLHGRSEALGEGVIDSTVRKQYNLDKTHDTVQMRLLPFALMVLAVLMVGTGVWVVRRR